MLQLTYISTATPGLTALDVADILKASRRNNAPAGLTGLLLHDGRRFLQALEGEAAQVQTAYERIKADRRHRAVVLLSSREVTARAFGDWAMAAQQVAPGMAGGNVVEQVHALTDDVADANLRETFRSFACLRAAAAGPIAA
jgi:hypothetical protein